jgi:hypothetical protein
MSPDLIMSSSHSDTDRKVASGWGAEEGKQELQAETEGYGDAAVRTPFSSGSHMPTQLNLFVVAVC